MKSKDRRHWILPPGAIQANQAMMEYVLERSVALLLVEDQERFFIASSVCVRIANRYLLATAGHNFLGDVVD